MNYSEIAADETLRPLFIKYLRSDIVVGRLKDPAQCTKAEFAKNIEFVRQCDQDLLSLIGTLLLKFPDSDPKEIIMEVEKVFLKQYSIDDFLKKRVQ